MHITTHFKAVFLLVNHLVAAHVPPELIAPAHRVPGATDLKARNVWQRSTPSDPASSLSADAIHLLSRQAKSGGSCDRKARCKKKNIRNPKDESKCIRCPPLTKPDPTRTLCIKNKDVSKDDKKKQMKEKLLEKVKEKMKQFKEKRKERLEKKKAEKNKEYEKKDATRKNELNKKKNRRMAQCLPLVAAAFGTAAMLELADGGFSEDLLESIDMDLLALWPKSEEISDDWFEKSVPGDLGDINKEDFAKAYIEYGDTQVVSVVVVAGRDVEERGDNHLGLGVSTTTEVSDYQHPEDKRFVQGAIALFGLIVSPPSLPSIIHTSFPYYTHY